MSTSDQATAARIRRPATPLSAGGWSTASFAISQAIGSLLYLPLARILTPDDFGVIAEAGLISGALSLLGEASLLRALVRMPGDRDHLANATTWLSVVVGVIGALLCALAGWPLAAWYGDDRLRLVMALLAPGVLFSALGAVPYALLSRELDFRRRTLPETVSIGGSGALALVAAALGAGVYALVVYAVVRHALATIVAWASIRWRPAFRRPDAPTIRAVVAYGLPATGGDLALYARLNTDYAISGRRLGSDALGVYTLAWAAASGPAALIGAFFGGAGFATFARLQRHRERLTAMYLTTTRLTACIAVPLFVSAVMLRQELVDTLYGSRWAAMVAPLLPLFLLQCIREVCGPGARLMLALGHSRLYFGCGLVMLPLTVLAVLVGTNWGIVGVSWAMLVAVGGGTLAWPTIALWLLRPPLRAVRRVAVTPMLLTLATVPSVEVARRLMEATDLPPAIRLVGATVAGAVGFGAGAWAGRGSLRADIERLREVLPEERGVELEAVPVSPPAKTVGVMAE